MLQRARRSEVRPGLSVRTVLARALTIAVSLAFVGAPPVRAQNGSFDLPRSSPEEQGIASSAILAFVEAADERLDAMHSFMLVRHGNVVAEGYWSPYDAETRHALYSLTKSFTSTAVGLAVAEGRVRTDDLVLSFFPEDAPPEPDERLKAMRVRDLLTMSTGQHAEAPLAPDLVWTKSFLSQPVDHKPGTFFLYNTPASYMLSAIVQKATGTTALDYLRPRLFEPLGIQDPVWPTSPQGVSNGGWGMKIRTREIARFGQLYLQKGTWRGKQLLPEAWVEAATSRQMSNGSSPESDWDQGYGYQFWRCRNNAYRGDGAFGQFCIVMPEQDAVVVVTSGVKSMQAVLNEVWRHLLPAMKPGQLPADDGARKKLDQTLARLRVRPQQGSASPAAATADVSRRYTFPANDQELEAVALEPGRDGADTLVLRYNGADQRIVCGRGAWQKGRLTYRPWPEQPVAASGAWTAPDTYTAKICFLEEPFYLTLNLRYAGDELRYGAEFNVAFGPTKQPELVGRAQ
jgi:CubicO group peptidase (beta-lactamase class C family)